MTTINKTFIQNARIFKSLKKRWSMLPPNMIFKVMENSDINERLLNKIRSNNINERIREHGKRLRGNELE